MARLNEPPAPVESLESLKRKFMRQNRDIARANSAQSQRIRNLENETSRLLADNLSLREEIIHLRHELDNDKAQRIVENTDGIKTQLEAKLLEIGALITSLGDGPAPRKRSPREDNVGPSPSQSPNQRDWKNMCTLSEAFAGQEGRLPPIMENKSYPRRTLEQQELMNVVAEAALDTTGSPDIGPPPVSQFVNEDPVKIDLPKRNKVDTSDDLPGFDPALSVNLEQRKKRRDSSVSSEVRRSNKAEPSSAPKEGTGTLKTGAKRKLSVREDEDHETVSKLSEPPLDAFKFTRVASEDKSKPKVVTQSEKSGGRVARELAIARGAPREKALTTAAPTSRKALASKNVNDSPRKRKAPLLDEGKAAKADIMKAHSSKDKAREKKHEHVPAKQSSNNPPDPTFEVQPEPETPAGIDMFSPSSSQPSTARAGTRDTPPPPDLAPAGEALRPSRRARAAVSYAEPSLRDKMRRPGKELVDAVVPGNQPHRTSIHAIKIEDDDPVVSLKIKPEPEADDAWKNMPIASSATFENSPLSSKILGPETLPSSITTHRKRRESILAEGDMTRSSSASAVAALLAGNRRLRVEAQERSLENKSVPLKSSISQDIYDFRGSSPAPPAEATEAAEAAEAVEPVKEVKAASRFSRRHSSVPREAAPVYDSESSGPEGSKKVDLFKSRRRQSTLSLRNSKFATTEPGSLDEAETSLKTTNSTTTLPGIGSESSEKVSARRRSMML